MVHSIEFRPFQPRERIFFNPNDTDDTGSLEDDLFLDAFLSNRSAFQSPLGNQRQAYDPILHLELKVNVDAIRNVFPMVPITRHPGNSIRQAKVDTRHGQDPVPCTDAPSVYGSDGRRYNLWGQVVSQSNSIGVARYSCQCHG